ncbi:MAG TPA: hypothetical protein VKE27_13115, partial [Candidatus Dormibacteraeota bacterium]|nr:hypothetical protein [Candidatus Dormibacteraeota bacterium]
TLIRATWPDRTQRRPHDALGVVPETAVLPHYDTFGHKWIESARRELPAVTLLGIDERTAAVCRDESWTAAGPGAVTVITATSTKAFRSGEPIDGLPGPVRILPQQ